MYQNVTEGKLEFSDKKLSKSSDIYYLEPGLYPSFTDIVEPMNSLIEEKHNHSENCIEVEVSRGTRKVEIYLTNEGSDLAFISTDMGHMFGSNVGNDFEVILKRKGPHKPEFAYDIARIHPHDIHRLDSLQCRPRHIGSFAALLSFSSKLKSGDLITAGQYMNYQTISNLQFRPLHKNSFHSDHIDLRDRSGEKIPFVSVGITRLVLMFRKASNIHF